MELLKADFASLKRSEGPENCPEYDDAVVLDLMADLVFLEPEAQRVSCNLLLSPPMTPES